MRIYVLRSSSGIAPYITAEVAVTLDEAESPYRENSAAGSLTWPQDILQSREELLSTKTGRRALHDWEAADDSRLEDQIDQSAWRDNCDDVRMMAERRSEPRAAQLIADGFPRAEVKAYLAETTEKPRLRLVGG